MIRNAINVNPLLFVVSKPKSMHINSNNFGEKSMNGSFQYGLKSRFYGMFSQWPWSLVITLIVLSPFIYYANASTRALVLELVIYWALFIALVLFVKDLYAQRFLYEFSVKGRNISIYKNTQCITEYTFDELKAVRRFSKKDAFARRSLESDGLLLKFKDGFEMPVFERVSNYEKFNLFLKKLSLAAG